MRDKKTVSKLICYSNPRSQVAEAYRTLRTNIHFSASNLKTMIVTSAEPGEGKTTTISNLAIVFAQSGKKVLLLDGDLRKPSVHRVFRLYNTTGLSDLLLGQIDDAKEVIQRIDEVGVDVIPAGKNPDTPTELISSPRMRELLDWLTMRYDLVLIDTPPLLPVTDSQVFSTFVDGVLLVIRSGKARREHVKKAKSLLDHVGAKVIGVVLNGKKRGREDKAYYEYTEKE